VNWLDDPIRGALATQHAALAQRHGHALRYPRDVAPFLGFDGPLAAESLDALVDGPTYLLGPRPDVPAGWEVDDLGGCLQMVCERPVATQPADAPTPLVTSRHREQVLELTALVYPHYFRTRTVELGRYFGVFEGDRLAAMIGERMALPGKREISAVCTHPDFLGRGLARRLLVWLANELHARGEQPFLHVAPANVRAVRLYEQNGFRVRTELPFLSLTRTTPGSRAR